MEIIDSNCYNEKKGASMSTVKSEVSELLKKLPENCSLEDIQYHLYVMGKIQNGTKRAEQEGTVSHEEVLKRLKKWRKN